MCRRNGCKKYGSLGVALDAIEIELCEDHRFEFSASADAEALNSEHARIKGEEVRELAALYGCGADGSFDAHIAGETTEERLARQLKFEQERSADLKAISERKDRLLIAAKAQQTKLKKRIQNGVCPCCHRTVSQLARHMATKHPDFQTQEVSQ